MKKILRFTNFKSDPFGNGADKRTAQVSAIFEREKLHFELLPSAFNEITFSLYYIRKWIRTVISFLRISFIIRRPIGILPLYRAAWLGSQFRGIFSASKSEDNDIFIWEATKTDFSYVLPVFRKKGYRIIGMPHNLESLVPAQKSAISGRISPEWLIEELKLLRLCEIVFCISKEETLLLKQCGINAEYLPYYPEKELLEKLLLIRRERESSHNNSRTKKSLLILGSAVNIPTRIGMENRIDFFKNLNADDLEILIAGYGTEILKPLTSDSVNINLIGAVSSEDLFGLLRGADAILIHQPPTSGALTRIVESLIAGVPVIANFESSRNYFGTDGVYVYNNDTQLRDLLKETFDMPQCPPYPSFEVSRFLCFLNKASF